MAAEKACGVAPYSLSQRANSESWVGIGRWVSSSSSCSSFNIACGHASPQLGTAPRLTLKSSQVESSSSAPADIWQIFGEVGCPPSYISCAPGLAYTSGWRRWWTPLSMPYHPLALVAWQ